MNFQSGWLLTDSTLSGKKHLYLDNYLSRFYQYLPQDTPLFHLYRWDQETINIGRFTRLSPDAEILITRGIPLVRRLTGGGIVRHYPGDISWGFLFNPARLGLPTRIQPIYFFIHKFLRKVLDSCGIATVMVLDNQENHRASPQSDCFLQPVAGDILFAETGRKVIGGALVSNRKGTVLYQGTLHLPEENLDLTNFTHYFQGIAAGWGGLFLLPMNRAEIISKLISEFSTRRARYSKSQKERRLACTFDEGKL